MTDEEFVKRWLKTPTGKSFQGKHPEIYRQLAELLRTPPLPIVDPGEGIGQCSCGKMKLGGNIQFQISQKEFMAICPFCASWSVHHFQRPPEKISE